MRYWAWEAAYRDRWAHDKIVRSTQGVNCTGSCSWKIYVKGGIVTWETQQTDYPRTRWDMPNHESRGCARGASYSWYLAAANVFTIKKYGPDRIIGFSPIPAMSMVSYAAGSRYLGLIGVAHQLLRLVLRLATGFSQNLG